MVCFSQARLQTFSKPHNSGSGSQTQKSRIVHQHPRPWTGEGNPAKSPASTPADNAAVTGCCVRPHQVTNPTIPLLEVWPTS
jgi:hypothetical protein